jgi:uncharacterized protein YcbK (DUF882 family)
MADRNDEEILRAILEKGGDKAKKAAADALAQQPPTPADIPEVKQVKARKTRRKLKEVAGSLGKQKFYYGPDGTIIDKDGQPAPERIAQMLVKKDEVANNIKKQLGIKPALSRTEQALIEKQQKEVEGKVQQLGKVTERVIATNNQMISRVPGVFTEFQNVLDNFATQNNMILDSLIKQNDEFQEKIMELLTGIKAPTKSSGETTRNPIPKKTTTGKKGKVSATRSSPRATTGKKSKPVKSRSAYQKRFDAMTPEQKEIQADRVQARAQRIGAIRTQRNIAAVAGGAAAGAAVGAGAAYGAYKLFSGDTTETKTPPPTTSGNQIPKISTENLDDGGRKRPELGEGKAVPTGAAPGALISQPQASAPAAPAAPGTQPQQQGAAPASGTPSRTPGMTTLKTPGGKSFDVASPYAANFQGFVTELENSGYKIKSIGGYANRNIAGTGKKSYHSLGVAIDINPSTNPHLFDGRKVTDMPANVGQMAAKYGLGWGGNWSSSKDTMHFSMAKGEGGAVAIDRSGATPLPGAPAAPGTMLAQGGPQGTTTGGTTGAPGAMLGSPQQTASLGAGAGTPQKAPDVGTAGAGAAPGQIVKVVEAGAGFNVVQLADGSTERRDGARNWRNNNPGNIQFGDFAKRYGALGTDGRFAIFPSYEAGRKAKEALLFEGKGYAGMNIQQAIYRYAPPNENNSANYVATVAGAVGVPASTPLSQLNAQQRTAMLNAMEKVEGFRTGKITKQGGAGTAVAGAPPTTAVGAAAAANQAAATTGAPQKAQAPTAASAAGAANQAATAQMTGEKPPNVSFESGKVDISKVDPKLLQGFYAAAREYGKPVRINSAYRGDEYQAQLWVRGRILKEPGIHIPAAPEKTTTITYKGQTYTVPGSGRGSSHGRGQAMDINPGVGSDFQRVLAKYGITYPFGQSDPPHIQLAGGSSYTPPAGGEPPQGSAAASAPAAPTAVAGATLANASAAEAIRKGTAPSGIQPVILNNTRTVNNTQVIRQGSSIPSCECRPAGFNPLAMVAGAALGKALRLF